MTKLPGGLKCSSSQLGCKPKLLILKRHNAGSPGRTRTTGYLQPFDSQRSAFNSAPRRKAVGACRVEPVAAHAGRAAQGAPRGPYKSELRAVDLLTRQGIAQLAPAERHKRAKDRRQPRPQTGPEAPVLAHEDRAA